MPLELKVRVGGDAGVPWWSGTPTVRGGQGLHGDGPDVAGRMSVENMRVRLPVMQRQPAA